MPTTLPGLSITKGAELLQNQTRIIKSFPEVASYLNFRRMTETLIVMLSLPFSLVGGLWLMWWLGFNLSSGNAYRYIPVP